MSETCKPDTYVGCPAPATPVSEVVVRPAEDLATTGIDPTAGLVLAWAMILAGAVGLAASRRMRKGKR